ncbi:MAG: hypothetical protein RLZZ501_1318 [Pseudomonadota bacterium]|jgi:polyhydroxyalkanoate synthase
MSPHHPPPPIPPRPGPRPLPLHLAIQLAILSGSLAALPLWKHGSLPWKPPLDQAAATLAARLAAAGTEAGPAFARALAAEAAGRAEAFLAGIEAYRRHPYRRDLPDPPTAWRAGTTRLLDYRPAGGGGLPLLVIPSLVNRAYILDLTARRSLMRYCAGRGLAPFLVDWDAPGAEEAGFTLTDYVARRLEPMLDHVTALCGRPPALVGYCMGGLLALALAQRRPAGVAALALLATPFDFAAGNPAEAALAGALGPLLAAALAGGAPLPVDGLQTLFSLRDPGLALVKFSAFAGWRRSGARARAFVAVEDWVNDGVPLAAAVATECLLGWYGANSVARGAWCIAGRPVRPEAVTVPTLALVPARDRIVPAASALPLAERIPGARIARLPGGHVGMLVGRRAATDCLGPLTRWLARHA